MNTNSLIAGLAIAALNTLSILPPLRVHAPYLVAASIVLALWVALKAATGQKPGAAVTAAPVSPAPQPPPAAVPPSGAQLGAAAPAVPAAQPPPPAAPVVRNLSEAEAIGLLGVFQTKGRLVDFLMDDIGTYSDAQVGAAARVVHQGCKAALQEHFTVVPVSTEREGSRVVVPAAAPAGDFEFVGKVAGQPPFSGVLVHKGWKATSVKLPRSLLVDAGRLPPIAPAQVELR